MDTFSVANFLITYEQLTRIERHISNPRDCVLIVLSVIGVLTPKMHAIASILIDDEGVYMDCLLNVLRYKFGSKWKLKKLATKKDFIAKLQSELLPGHITFCYFKWKREGIGHVTMIARDQTTGMLYYMDPQSSTYLSITNPYIWDTIFEQIKEFSIITSNYTARLPGDPKIRPPILN